MSGYWIYRFQMLDRDRTVLNEGFVHQPPEAWIVEAFNHGAVKIEVTMHPMYPGEFWIYERMRNTKPVDEPSGERLP